MKIEFIESYIHDDSGDYQWSDNHGELIRCKDCRHNGSFDTDCPISWPKEEDSYCSFAERRTDG